MISINSVLDAWVREKPDLDTSPMGVVGRLSRVAFAVDSMLDSDYAQWGLDAGLFDVLFTLRRSGSPYSLTPTELVASSMVSSAATTQRLNRLEAAGLVRREPNPGDGRGRIVKLTPEGRMLTDRALPSHLAAEERFLLTLGAEQRSQLNDLLDRLLAEAPDSGSRGAA